MSTTYKKLGIKVRKLRKVKGLTQEELAERIGRDPRTIVAIEAGERNPTLQTIQRLSKALGVPQSELLS